MAKFLVLTCVVLAALLGPVLSIPKSKINPTLQASFTHKTHDSHDVVVNFRTKTTSVLDKVQVRNFATRAEKLNLIAEELEALAKTSQNSIIQLLNSPTQRLSGITYNSFWVSNQVFVREADENLIKEMAALDEVEEIREQYIITLEEPRGREVQIQEREFELDWGVKTIGADKVWAEGINGTGIVVGGIDTGVRGTHQELESNFVGEYGWYDPVGNSAVPIDAQGHGTHTMGTIAGQSGIGVAPGVKWMACRACEQRGCIEEDLIACGEFMTCPTQGGNRNCSRAPQVVSNSWGRNVADDNFYDAVIQAWHAAGIVPVFAIGNSGQLNECQTLTSPGDRNVIGVGSSRLDNGLSWFSSVGPSSKDSELIKPDVVAPGQDIYSAGNGTDNEYLKMSGTSMATPHVAGVIALMLQETNNLTYAEIKEKLFSGAAHNIVVTGKDCGGIKDSDFPNHSFGYGRVRAWESIYGSSSSSNVQSIAGLVLGLITLLRNIH